ncbi:MAG: CPBP family intramembrane metalloprotease [Phycisphaerales bacterium]|nr:CPBP family intramembrane metalloprotease [Phycisphaerales bacterium]
MLDPFAPAVATDSRSADPGTPLRAWLCGIIAVVCILTVMFLNQTEAAPSSTKSAAQASKAAAATSNLDPSDPFIMSAKVVTKLAYDLGAPDDATRRMLIAQTKSPYEDRKPDATEQVRRAIVAAEIMGDKGGAEAERAFFAMETEFADRADREARVLEPEEKKEIEEISADIATLRAVYAGQPIDDASRDRLVARHGWFAKVAMTYGKPKSDPVRADLLGGGLVLFSLLIGIIFLMLGGVLAGFACFVVAIVLFATGRMRPRFVKPAPGGSFGWELLAGFTFTFLAFKLIMWMVVLVTAGSGGTPPAWLPTAALLGQWAVALAVFTPMVFGVGFGEWSRLTGWIAPRGLFRELGAGLFGYLAGLPLVIGALLVSLVLDRIYLGITGQGPRDQSNPILELASRSDAFTLVLLFTLATVWAPLVEETVFRGGMYRALRTRLHAILAGLVSAVCFGIMHGYPLLLLGPVMAIGLTFALMREWRGSIIGPVFGHFLNNATVLGLLFVVMALAK